MTEVEMVKVFKCLADQSRLLILKSLTKEDMYVERLSERLSLAPATVSFHLKKLEEIGAVKSRKEQYYTVYSLCPEVFSVRIIDLLKDGISNDNIQDERDEAYRQKVLSSFMEYGKLKTMPAQLKKKNIILEEICKAFEADRTYIEKEVNLIIADFYEDFCTIRRDMVGAGLLSRQNGIYCKSAERAK